MWLPAQRTTALAGVVEGGEMGLEGAASTGAEEATESAAQTGAEDLLKKGFKTGGKVLNKLAGPTEFTAPAQAAGYAESHAIYRDSWNRTANPQYKTRTACWSTPATFLMDCLASRVWRAAPCRVWPTASTTSSRTH